MSEAEIHGVLVGPEFVRSAGGKVTASSEIAAVHIETVTGSRAPGIVVAVVGVVVGGACLATGSESQALGLVFAGVALVVGLAMAAMAHDRYVVRLELHGAKRRVLLGTAERDQAEEVAAAVQAARGVEEQKKPPTP